MRRLYTAAEPLAVAHRAGNDIPALQWACAAGVDLVEADVRYHRGRLEVRHFKTMGPVPVLWDRWALAPGWTARFQLAGLLANTPPGCELMLDVKGGGEEFPREVVRAVRQHMPGREYSVCSQYWSLLDAFHEDPHARVIHSIGSAKMLAEVVPRLDDHRCDAVSIHMKLLSPAVVETLFRQVSLIMTWPVNREADLRRLQSWGVNGYISDSREILELLVRERAARPAPNA